MGAKVINLFVIVAVGTMLADMIANPSGTKAFFDGIGAVWQTSINGMLGKPSK